MNNGLTAKWHELDKARVGLKDVVVLRPDLRVADGNPGVYGWEEAE